MKTYNIQTLINLLKDCQDPEAMAVKLKTETPEPAKRAWFMSAMSADLNYFGEHLAYNMRLDYKQARNIRNFVQKPKEIVNIMWWE